MDIHWWTLGGGHSRHLVDTCFLDVRTCVGSVWDMFGRCLGHVWDMFGTCLGHVWKVFGTCLESV